MRVFRAVVSADYWWLHGVIVTSGCLFAPVSRLSPENSLLLELVLVSVPRSRSLFRSPQCTLSLARGCLHARGAMASLLHSCNSCLTLLSPEDGHDLCPQCLGIGHLRQALTEDACFNCVSMPFSERSSRLELVEGTMPKQTLASSPVKGAKRRKRPHTEVSMTKKSRHDQELSTKVDTLASEFAQIKSLLLNLQPGGPPAVCDPTHDEGASQAELSANHPQEDAMSIAASDTLFTAAGPDGGCHSPDPSVLSSNSSDLEQMGMEPELSSVHQAIQLALSRLGVETPVGVTPTNAFFRVSQKPVFTVPASLPYIDELQRCWADPKSFIHLTKDCRILSSMQDATNYGLDRMPAVDATIAGLVVAPADAARAEARCPRPQCRVTDDLITKSYDTAARIGRLGNSLSHLALALSQSLRDTEADTAIQSLSDASLQAFAYMSRELGRLMATLTIARRQVWLAQSPLSESCRGALRTLPVVPGQIFGPAAQQTLERAVEANKSRRQFAELHRAPRPQPRGAMSFRPSPRASSFQRPGHAPDNQAQSSQSSLPTTFRPPRGRAPRNDRQTRRDRPPPPRAQGGHNNRA